MHPVTYGINLFEILHPPRGPLDYSLDPSPAPVSEMLKSGLRSRSTTQSASIKGISFASRNNRKVTFASVTVERTGTSISIQRRIKFCIPIVKHLLMRERGQSFASIHGPSIFEKIPVIPLQLAFLLSYWHSRLALSTLEVVCVLPDRTVGRSLRCIYFTRAFLWVSQYRNNARGVVLLLLEF